MANLIDTIVNGPIIHKEGTVVTSGTTLTLDYSTGISFEVDMSSYTNNPDVFAVNGVSGDVFYKSFILQVKQKSGTPWRTFAWSSINNVKWPGGSGPTLTQASNKKDIYSFTSWDNGTTWYGKVIGQNYS